MSFAQPSPIKDVRPFASLTLVLAALAFAYWDVAAGLVRQWSTDDNYSHGFVVVPLAIWFAWERRKKAVGSRQKAVGSRQKAVGSRQKAVGSRQQAAGFEQNAAGSRADAAGGLATIVLSLGVLVVGVLGAELFLTRLSFIGVLAGLVWFLGGRASLRALAFPLAFLLLMIPLPALIFNKIAFPLQLFASQAGAGVLELAGVPVFREGNILQLATTKLEVAEACSGIRSLVSLLTLAIVLGQFSLQRRWTRVALALAAVPVAIVTNAMRVAGTGLAAHFWSPEVAEGVYHAFSGWAVFALAFAALLAAQRLALKLEEQQTGRRTRASAVAVEA